MSNPEPRDWLAVGVVFVMTCASLLMLRYQNRKYHEQRKRMLKRKGCSHEL